MTDSGNRSGGGLRITVDVRLPKSYYTPASSPKATANAQVSLPITLYFRDPIRSISSSAQLPFKGAPVAPMPEIAIAEDGHLLLAKDHVRTAGEVTSMGSKAQSAPTEQSL